MAEYNMKFIRIENGVHTRLKVYCAKNKLTFSDAVEQLLDLAEKGGVKYER